MHGCTRPSTVARTIRLCTTDRYVVDRVHSSIKCHVCSRVVRIHIKIERRNSLLSMVKPYVLIIDGQSRDSLLPRAESQLFPIDCQVVLFIFDGQVVYVLFDGQVTILYYLY